jgi:hypothetical protein
MAKVVFPAPEPPITAVVEFSLIPPSNSGFKPNTPVFIFFILSQPF